MNKYDNGETTPISATVQEYWEEQNDIVDEACAEACSEAEQADQEARCAEYEAAEAEQARYEADYEAQAEEEYYP